MCLLFHLSGAGINVEIAPILYEGDEKWRGYLWDRMTNKRILTSIPLHLDFIIIKENSRHFFAQVIRLVKWWAQQRDG